MSSFGIHARFAGPFDVAVAKVTDALKGEGFGVLTEIDVKETLAKKLGVDFRRYKILGACNPPFAHRALQANLDVGLLLPCNVVVYEENAETTHVAAIDPLKTVAAQGDPVLATFANEVGERLARAVASVEKRM